MGRYHIPNYAYTTSCLCILRYNNSCASIYDHHSSFSLVFKECKSIISADLLFFSVECESYGISDYCVISYVILSIHA